MQTITSFHSAGLEPEQTAELIAEYLALEQARSYRRLCQTRFVILALVFGAIGFGFRWLPPFASWFSVASCLAVPAWAWSAELRREFRLTRALKELPAETARVVICGEPRKS
jgi:hypothetical protein